MEVCLKRKEEIVIRHKEREYNTPNSMFKPLKNKTGK